MVLNTIYGINTITIPSFVTLYERGPAGPAFFGFGHIILSYMVYRDVTRIFVDIIFTANLFTLGHFNQYIIFSMYD